MSIEPAADKDGRHSYFSYTELDANFFIIVANANDKKHSLTERE